MRCPNCLSESIEPRITLSHEPHGEVFEDLSLECQRCHSEFDASDLVTLPEIEVELWPSEEWEIAPENVIQLEDLL